MFIVCSCSDKPTHDFLLCESKRHPSAAQDKINSKSSVIFLMWNPRFEWTQNGRCFNTSAMIAMHQAKKSNYCSWAIRNYKVKYFPWGLVVATNKSPTESERWSEIPLVARNTSLIEWWCCSSPAEFVNQPVASQLTYNNLFICTCICITTDNIVHQ